MKHVWRLDNLDEVVNYVKNERKDINKMDKYGWYTRHR